MIKDRGQKEMLYRHFRAQGWLAQIEVPVAPRRAVSRNVPLVTDIDVLGLRPSSELRWRYVVGDCKTKRKESPVNRALWARGLMDSVGASSGLVLLRRERGNQIERDHKLFAEGLDVILLDETDFPAYDRAIVYPGGSSGFREELSGVEEVRTGLGTRFPALADFASWLMSDSWRLTDHGGLLRATLARGRDVRGEVNPTRDDHLALALELACTLAVPFATLVGTVFRRHIQPADRGDLDEAARVIIWGGREQYDYFARVRAELVAAKGLSDPQSLALPEWERFLELLRSALERPRTSFQVPQLLRAVSLGLAVGGDPRPALAGVGDRELLNAAMRLAIYAVRAATWPRDFEARIKAIFVPRISEVVQTAADVGRPRPGQLDLLDPRAPAPKP